jgi:N,N'-diacetyllegionaminate synthase
MKNKKFNFKNKVLIIAEIGNNHEGSFKLAKRLIEKAAKAGVDAVKFQTFKTEKYVNDKDQSRYERLKKFELSKEDFYKLSKFAKSKKLIFISTPFDIQSAIDLNKCVDYFKISSGDNNYFQLIEKIISFKKPIIISTGLLDNSGIVDLLKIIKKRNFPMKKVFFLHCVSDYPVVDKEANLISIKYLSDKFKVNIGYSDHTLGIEASIMAVAYGAKIIEKHFTIDKNFSKFRDHKLSADPKEMLKLVESVRRSSIMGGVYTKKISKNEKKNLKSMRRSLYATVKINKGEKITIDKIKFVRPFNSLSSIKIDDVLNKKAKSIINKSQPIYIKSI